MIGHPKHIKKALDARVDLICAQAGEGGGHTGEISASIFIPAVVDAVKGRTSLLTDQSIWVVGTRFVASEEAGREHTRLPCSVRITETL